MKRAALIVLGLSLLANAAFVTVLVWREMAKGVVGDGDSGSVARTAVEATPPAPASATASTVPETRSWQNLSSDDLPTLVANLRSAGFPEKITRAIVGAILGERFAARRKALLGDNQIPPFWKTRSTAIDRSRMADLRALSREQADAMKQLLGSDPPSDEARYTLRRLYGDLPAEKLDLVQRIQSDYAELQNQIRLDAGGSLLPEDRESVALLEKEKRADLASVLTAAELEMFDLFNSTSANVLRVQLDGIAPTEQEFRTLFALRRDFDQRFNTTALNSFDENVMRERLAAEQQMNEQIKASLGEARYADYQRVLDSGYRIASKIAERYNLPLENAVAVYDLQKDAQQRIGALRGDRQAIATIVREANDRLNVLLGRPGADAYKETAGGWLRSLERMTTTPPTTPSPSG